MQLPKKKDQIHNKLLQIRTAHNATSRPNSLLNPTLHKTYCLIDDLLMYPDVQIKL